MNTTLCIDFGNTKKKVAVFKKDVLQEVIYLENDDIKTIEKLLKKTNPNKTILSSVIEHNISIEKLLANYSHFHLLNSLTKLPFTTPVRKPHTIGADRLALAAGAAYFYPKKNNLIIATGTCITYNFINNCKEFIGGAISPGIEMKLNALTHYTSKLPLVKANFDVPLIGYDTETNITSGVILGTAFEIDGFIKNYEEKFNNFNVVLTGGNTMHLATHIKSKIFADPNFLFKGLYAISEKN